MRSKYPLYSNKYMLEKQQRFIDRVNLFIAIGSLIMGLLLTCVL